MSQNSMPRRSFLRLTTAIGSVAVLTRSHGSYDVTTELSDTTYKIVGRVIGKKHLGRVYKLPSYDLDQQAYFKVPEFYGGPEKYNIEVQIGNHTAFLDDMDIFKKVEQGSELGLTVSDIFSITQKHNGEAISRKFEGYHIISARSPDNNPFSS